MLLKLAVTSIHQDGTLPWGLHRRDVGVGAQPVCGRKGGRCTGKEHQIVGACDVGVSTRDSHGVNRRGVDS